MAISRDEHDMYNRGYEAGFADGYQRGKVLARESLDYDAFQRGYEQGKMYGQALSNAFVHQTGRAAGIRELLAALEAEIAVHTMGMTPELFSQVVSKVLKDYRARYPKQEPAESEGQ